MDKHKLRACPWVLLPASLVAGAWVWRACVPPFAPKRPPRMDEWDAPRLVERGHDVIVYCRSSLFPERPRSYRGVRLIYLPSIETKNLSTPTHTLLCSLDVLFRGVDVMMTLTTPNCPAAGELPTMVENAVASVPGVGVVNVNLVWDPAWTPDRMSDEARLVLNMW